MTELLKPDDAFLQFLAWVGAPFCVITAINFLIFVANWISAALSATRTSTTIVQNLGKAFQENTSDAARALLTLLLSGSLFVALAYSGSTFAAYLLADQSRGWPDSDRLLKSPGYALHEVSGYQNWSTLSECVTAAALAGVVVMTFALAVRRHWLERAALYALAVPLVAMLVGGCLVALAGLCMLALALAGDQDSELSMTWSYLFWVVVLWGAPITAAVFLSQSRRFWREPSARRVH